ncbi:MAG: citryl-CoA lyase [Archaeoglobi archaeon]|nr:citryl-CoA lyase [Candidatus Mnemosynella sp.]
MTSNPWRTAISKVVPNRVYIRGYDVTELAGNVSFGDVVYLLWTGELPQGNEGKILEDMFVIAADFSLNAPSTGAVRFVASCGVPVQAAVAAGVIAIGDLHGGAIEGCAKMLKEGVERAKKEGKSLDEMAEIIIKEHKEAGKRILGFGHPIHNNDSRRFRLFELAKEYGVAGDHIALAEAIEAKTEELIGRKLIINVDGAMAAVLADIGIDPMFGKAAFFVPRAAGLTAHAIEEMTRERPWRHVTLDECTYDGPDVRPLPERFKKKKE